MCLKLVISRSRRTDLISLANPFNRREHTGSAWRTSGGSRNRSMLCRECQKCSMLFCNYSSTAWDSLYSELYQAEFLDRLEQFGGLILSTDRLGAIRNRKINANHFICTHRLPATLVVLRQLAVISAEQPIASALLGFRFVTFHKENMIKRATIQERKAVSDTDQCRG